MCVLMPARYEPNPFDIIGKLSPGNKRMAAGSGICDFCNPAQPSVWLYPCKSFVFPQLKGVQAFGGFLPVADGDWGACETCADLIERKQIETLARRCGHDHPALISLQRRSLQLFFKNRTGEARRSVDGQSAQRYGHTVITPDE